ncbi:MAG TPA: 3D domain-containing protein [Blastocatellia bacterium]|nr:3D domain-containing protein [Blastocatellia bacterium]
MDQNPRRRFTEGLSSGIFILLFFAVGYFVYGETRRVIAADDPSSPARHTDPTDIPAPPKDLSGAAEEIDSKETAGEINKEELQDFHATAYCLKGRTASGEPVRPGIIAADPRVLPLGTVVHLKAGRYTGTYTVLDTGRRIKGRKVDIYVPSYKEAKKFGRQRVKLKVIRKKS